MGVNTICIVQARMGSSRLPGKVLLPLMGETVLWHIYQRLNIIDEIQNTVIATSTEAQDEKIVSYCESRAIPVHRGSENDVLDRFYKAASAFKADAVVRITADCPLVDPQIITKLISTFRGGSFDHCGIAAGAGVANDEKINRYPDGLDAEIFTMKSLKDAWTESTKTLHREHVTPFIWQQPDRYELGKLACDQGDLGQHRWTLDNQEDYELISWIYEHLHSESSQFGMNDVLELLATHPEKQQLNKHLIGKEGYEEFWE